MSETAPTPLVIESPPEKEPMFSKKDITPADLKAARTELHEREKEGDWIGTIRHLSYLKRAGVVLKGEKQSEWKDKFVDQLDTLRTEAQTKRDPRKLVLYFSHLRYNGFLEDDILTDADKSLMQQYYKDRSKDGQDKNFARFCASLRYLDVEKKFDTAQPILNAELQRVRKESRPGKKVLTAVRLGYAIYGKEDLSTYLNGDGEYEKGQLLADVNETREGPKGTFARSVALYQFATGDEYGLRERDIKSLRGVVESVRKQGPRKFFRYIGQLATLWRQGRKKEQDIPVDIVDNERLNDNVLTEEDSGLGTFETIIGAGDTAIQPQNESTEDTPSSNVENSERGTAETSATKETPTDSESEPMKDPFSALEGQSLWEKTLPRDTLARSNHIMKLEALKQKGGKDIDPDILVPLEDGWVKREFDRLQQSLRQKPLKEWWREMKGETNQVVFLSRLQALQVWAGALRWYHLRDGSSEREILGMPRKEVEFAQDLIQAIDTVESRLKEEEEIGMSEELREWIHRIRRHLGR